MKEIINYLNKEIEKENLKLYLEIIMILDEISKKENIISFSYDYHFLMIQVGANDYYRIRIKKEVIKC